MTPDIDVQSCLNGSWADEIILRYLEAGLMKKLLYRYRKRRAHCRIIL